MDYTKNLRMRERLSWVGAVPFMIIIYFFVLARPAPPPPRTPVPPSENRIACLEREVEDLRWSLQVESHQQWFIWVIAMFALLPNFPGLILRHIEALEAEVVRLTGNSKPFRDADEGKRIGPPSRWFQKFMGVAGQTWGRLCRLVQPKTR